MTIIHSYTSPCDNIFFFKIGVQGALPQGYINEKPVHKREGT